MHLSWRLSRNSHLVQAVGPQSRRERCVEGVLKGVPPIPTCRVPVTRLGQMGPVSHLLCTVAFPLQPRRRLLLGAPRYFPLSQSVLSAEPHLEMVPHGKRSPWRRPQRSLSCWVATGPPAPGLRALQDPQEHSLPSTFPGIVFAAPSASGRSPEDAQRGGCFIRFILPPPSCPLSETELTPRFGTHSDAGRAHSCWGARRGCAPSGAGPSFHLQPLAVRVPGRGGSSECVRRLVR